MREQGFTLVEILVVMVITAIVGTILVIIFANTLRGSNKSQVLAVIKQNGQAVLENMDKTIRGADNVVCPSSSSDTMAIVKNGTYIRYRFVAPPPSNTSNGLIQQDIPVKQDVTGSNPLRKETDTEFISRICGSLDPMSAATGLIILTDTNIQTGVSVVNCILSDCKPVFVRNKSAGFKDQITIQFNLKPGIGVPPAISSQIDPVAFQTTIGLR